MRRWEEGRGDERRGSRGVAEKRGWGGEGEGGEGNRAEEGRETRGKEETRHRQRWQTFLKGEEEVRFRMVAH